ncbi:MAG TPA: type II toxin-antitoxin system RelE/ParE family toxin [Terriglobales bacterium]|nr:type II toxin-antitoxin system RelE/ParE family toxin [Terriglobales bacterium]
MTIRWTKDAVQQLAAAVDYVAADNIKAADALFLKITESVRRLEFFPKAGREGRVKNTRELVIVGTPYHVAYRLKGKSTVQVLALLHGRRRWPKSF